MTRSRWGTSAFIVAVLGLQAVAVLHEIGGGRETLWPFLPWGMFRQASSPPVEAVLIRIYAETSTGARHVGPEDAGLDRFAFRLHYRTRLAAGDSVIAEDLARRLSERWGTPVRGVAAQSTRFTLEDERLVAESSVRRYRTGTR